MILQTFYPVIVPMDSGPMSPEEHKMFVGVWIFMNVWWGATLLYSLGMAAKEWIVAKPSDTESLWYYFWDRRTGAAVYLDIAMGGCWAILIVFAIGEFIAIHFL